MRGLFMESKELSNYRQFCGSEHLKNKVRVGAIQKECQLGIQDADNIFCTSHESNAHRTVACIEAFKELVVQHGMEGVFIIVTPLETINMLETPGKVSKVMVQAWIKDLLVDGVFDLHNPSTRLPVCPHDNTNLSWAGKALLNSSSLAMRKEVTSLLTEVNRTGPQVFQTIMTSTFRPSQSTIEALKEKLKKLKLTDFAGESVEAFNVTAIPIIEEIEMSSMGSGQIIGLASAALTGLTCGNDERLKQKVMEQQMKCNVNAFDNGIGNEDVIAK